MENTNKKFKIIYGDNTLGVKGEGYHLIFNYLKGGLESLKINGKEWMYRIPKPTFWRATTDNDRGSQFSIRSSMWLGADLFIRCIDTKVMVDEKIIELPAAPRNNQYSNEEYADHIKLSYTFETSTYPSTTVDVIYEIQQSSIIKINMYYHGKAGLPELPLLGMRFIMPTKADGYSYEGLSGETYPDRKSGGINGIYQVENITVTPYLVPQDCGVHMDTKWLEIKRTTTLNNADESKEPFFLRFRANEEPFAFSCLPYTAPELENATHMEELPHARRTVVSILARVRGVGGIDSWGSDVESPYRIFAQEDAEISFEIDCKTLD